MEKTEIVMNGIKLALAGFGAWLSAKLGILGPVLLALLIAMVIDYVSGMLAAWLNGELSSKKGVRGILKKLAYIFAVVAAMLLDWLILTLAAQFGAELPVTTFFGLLVTIWFVLNEILSILENLGRLGVTIPEFLKKAVATLKGFVEKQGDNQSDHPKDEKE